MSYPKSRLGKLFIKKADLLRELDAVLDAIDNDSTAKADAALSSANATAAGYVSAARLRVNGTQVTDLSANTSSITITSGVANIAVGIEPEESFETARTSSASWWSSVSGLTPIKYFDARYSAQAVGSISAWDDIVGGADAVQVLAPQNPALIANGFSGDNGQYVEFRPATASTPELLACDSMATALTIPYTLVSVVRHNVIDNTVKNMAAAATGGGFQWYTNLAGSVAWVQDNVGGTTTFNNAGARLSTSRVNLHALCVNGANSYLWDNGIKQVGNLTLSGTYAPTTAKIGAYSTSQNGFNGDMRAFAAFTGAATQAQLEAVFSGLCGQVPTNLVHVGDSLSGGVGGTALPTQVAGLMSEYTWVSSDAIGGSTLVDMAARFTANVTPKYQPAMRNVLVLWGGTNDIYYGATGTLTASRLWAYCDLARKAGWHVVVISMLPRGPFDSTQDGYISDFNAEVAQRWHAHADAVLYVHKILGLSAYNQVNWDDDTIHLKTVGYALVARAVSSAVRAICQS
jgi:lysophospholipase L1-like esterase